MTSKWRKDRKIVREKVTNKGDMSTQDFRDLYKKQYQRCMFTGMRLELDTTKLMAFSQDRINSEISYDMGNVQFVLLRLNKRKNDMKDSLFRDHLASLYND